MKEKSLMLMCLMFLIIFSTGQIAEANVWEKSPPTAAFTNMNYEGNLVAKSITDTAAAVIENTPAVTDCSNINVNEAKITGTVDTLNISAIPDTAVDDDGVATLAFLNSNLNGYEKTPYSDVCMSECGATINNRNNNSNRQIGYEKTPSVAVFRSFYMVPMMNYHCQQRFG